MSTGRNDLIKYFFKDLEKKHADILQNNHNKYEEKINDYYKKQKELEEQKKIQNKIKEQKLEELRNYYLEKEKKSNMIKNSQ